jgi:hypothetical protein
LGKPEPLEKLRREMRIEPSPVERK